MRMPPIVLLTALIVSGAAAQDSQPPRPGDWPAYSHDQMGQRYSPLAQINSANVSRLRRVWTYGVATGPVDPNPANRLESTTEAVPIVVNGVLYSPTVQHSIVALEPETGEELWKFDLGRASGTLRGVTYWAGDANDSARIFDERRLLVGWDIQARGHLLGKLMRRLEFVRLDLAYGVNRAVRQPPSWVYRLVQAFEPVVQLPCCRSSKAGLANHRSVEVQTLRRVSPGRRPDATRHALSNPSHRSILQLRLRPRCR